MRQGAGSRGNQRVLDNLDAVTTRLEKRGRMLPVPVTNLSATASLKTRGAQISFLITSLQGIDSFLLLRNFSRDPGSAKAIHTWTRASLVTTPQVFPLLLTYPDADQAISGKVAYYWIRVVPASQKTLGNEFLCGPQQFDASLFPAAFTITADLPIGQAYTPTTQPVTAATGGSANHATINIAPFQIQFPAPLGLVSYSAGSVTPLLDSTVYYVYCNDPTYQGGAQTYFATTLNPDITADGTRLYFGKVTTPAFGAGNTGGSGGGGGPCFSGNTLIITRYGDVRIKDIAVGDEVMTRSGWRKVVARLEHDYDGEMRNMGGHQLVTPEHKMWHRREWTAADAIFLIVCRFTGKVFNLSVQGESDLEHCYTLVNGWIAHNVLK